MADPSTNADPAAAGWIIDDPVIRLRVVGSQRSFELEAAAEWVLGASPECSIQLDDPSGRVSRRHASLERDGNAWVVRDLDSRNGIRQDGEARLSFPLAPGVQLGLGGVTLLAESRRSIELHAFLQRVLGWSAPRLADVDRALAAVRDLANLRAGLILRGEGSLLGVARRLHRLTLGAERPFVARAPDEPGVHALDRAPNGMLCLDAEALPGDLHQVIAGLRLPDARVRLVVTARTTEAAAEITTLLARIATISIPALGEREDEIDQLLEAFARDAVAALGAPDLGFRPQDLAWVRASGVKTLDEIEDVTHRLVALRNWGVTAGAERLGITHGALSRWARRRKLPT